MRGRVDDAGIGFLIFPPHAAMDDVGIFYFYVLKVSWNPAPLNNWTILIFPDYSVSSRSVVMIHLQHVIIRMKKCVSQNTICIEFYPICLPKPASNLFVIFHT